MLKWTKWILSAGLALLPTLVTVEVDIAIQPLPASELCDALLTEDELSVLFRYDSLKVSSD